MAAIAAGIACSARSPRRARHDLRVSPRCDIKMVGVNAYTAEDTAPTPPPAAQHATIADLHAPLRDFRGARNDGTSRFRATCRGGRRTCASPDSERILGDAGRASRCKDVYGEADVAGLDFVDGWPGLPPVLRGPYPTMYVDQPWTIRQYAGFSTAEESNAFYRRNLAGGQKGPVGRLRPADAPRLRLRRSAHRRRRRHGRRRGRLDLRHADAVRRHSARLDQRVDDDERRGAAGDGALHRRGRGTGRGAGATSPAPSRTTSSRSSWSATPTSTRPVHRCGSSPTSSPTRRGTCRSSIRSRSPAITCRKRERPPTSSSATRSPTGWNTSSAALQRRASRSISSRRASRSSSTSA